MAYWFAQIKISHKYRSAHPSHWVTMTESNSLDINKKLSPEIIEQAKQLIALVDDSVEKAEDSLKHLLEFMKTNNIPTQFMRELYARHLRNRGLSTSTIERRLPNELKDPIKLRARSDVKMRAIDDKKVLEQRVKSNQVRLVVDEEPKIPPRPEVIQDIEPEPPRPVIQPITIPIPKAKSNIIKGVIFDPAPIDRDRTQVFILEIDIDTKKVNKYKTVGRRTIGR